MPHDDYQQYFAEDHLTDDLHPCPCCGSKPAIVYHGEDALIICPKNGCKHVWCKSLSEAVKLWQELRFTERTPIKSHELKAA